VPSSMIASFNPGTILLAVIIILGVISVVGYQDSFSQAEANENNVANQVRFSKPVNLTNNARDSVYAQVATHGNNVFVVWQEDPPSRYSDGDNLVNYEILIKKSVDGGLTFGDEINLSNNPGFSEHPQIATSGNNVYVAWIDNSPLIDSFPSEDNKKIIFRKSTDGGNTFGEMVTLSNVPAADSFNQEMAAAGNKVYVVWQVTPLLPTTDRNNIGTGNAEAGDESSILLATSTDNGETFEEAKSLSNNAFKSYPKVAAYENNVYVVWNVGIIGDNANRENDSNNNSSADSGIFLTKSFDSGRGFDDTIKLSANWNSVGESQVAATGDNVYVVWGGNPDEKVAGNLFYTLSSNDGTTFSAPTTFTEKNTLNVEVATDNNAVYIAWQGVLEDGNEEIYIKKSLDAGATFTEFNENISKNEGVSECTSIAISEDSKKVYLAWEDSPARNHEILLARSL
jgi:hypothetical protein